MLFQCWASVEDGGPTLRQHWASTTCLLDSEGDLYQAAAKCLPHHAQQTRHVNPKPVQCWSTVASSSRQSFNTEQCFLLAVVCPQSTSGHRCNVCKCWASIAGAGQYPFILSQYLMMTVPARCFEPKRGNVGRRL